MRRRNASEERAAASLAKLKSRLARRTEMLATEIDASRDDFLKIPERLQINKDRTRHATIDARSPRPGEGSRGLRPTRKWDCRVNNVVINEWNIQRTPERAKKDSPYRRSRSLSFNSQSFGTAVPECPWVVRKIPRIVFIQLRGRRGVQSSARRTVSISLLLLLRLLLLPLRPTLVSATIFSSFQNRLRREDNGLRRPCDRERSTRKRSHRFAIKRR